MNNRHSLLVACLAISFCLGFCLVASAQSENVALPDSLPHPDSLSQAELSALAVQLLDQARIFDSEFSRRAFTAAVVRESEEQNLKTAKQDTLTPKPTLDSLSSVLKTAKSAEKTAQKNQKQAAQVYTFTDKVVGMDSLNQRKNIRKAWKQVKELDALLHPPAEKPVADILNAVGTPEAPADSSAMAEKRKAKEKKPEKPGPKYKSYDPAADVLLNPPKRPCVLAVHTRDEFSGQTYRETGREELFRFTNEIMKKVLPPDQPHIVCEAALSSSGANSSLHLTFTIRDPNARKAFGSLAKGSIASLKFLDGDTFTLNNTRNDDGVRDESGQVFTYQAQYPLDAALMKKLRKTELDKLRIAWSTGYEDYDVQGIDVLMREGKCLFE